MNAYKIIETPGNREGNLPAHWDVIAPGSTDSCITVWSSRQLADRVVHFLNQSLDRPCQKPLTHLGSCL